VRNKIGKIARIFGKIEDPKNRGVLYLPKYFGNFGNFTSHTKSIYLKNIGHDCGNTIQWATMSLSAFADPKVIAEGLVDDACTGVSNGWCFHQLGGLDDQSNGNFHKNSTTMCWTFTKSYYSTQMPFSASQSVPHRSCIATSDLDELSRNVAQNNPIDV
jgi:hypothetical protein